MKFLIYSGSARKGNYTQHVAEFVLSVVNQHSDIKAELITPKGLGIDFSNEGMEAEYPELREKVKEADGFILVSPEYNHGYSGSLKYMLDLNLKEYIHKPVAFVGVSKGPWGGTRVIESLVPVVRELGLVATFTDLNVTNVQEEIDVETETFKDSDKWQKRTERLLEELVWMAKALKRARST